MTVDIFSRRHILKKLSLLGTGLIAGIGVFKPLDIQSKREREKIDR